VLTLEAATYRAVPTVAPQVREGAHHAAAFMGRLVGEEIERVAAHLRPEEVAIRLCVSTMMDLPFVMGWLRWPQVREDAGAYTRLAPENFSASYECAGWGFALAYARRHCWPGSALVISVVDLNLLDISFWRNNPEWGKSGFGISTVVLRVPESGGFELEARASQSGFHMGEFCAALRKWLAKSPSACTNAPFLPPSMTGIYDHFLPKDRLLPDLHPRWGHCFGSDTWISYITHIANGRLRRGGHYTATSASLRGFWAITDLRLAEDGVFGFVGADGQLEPV
jgi:hypothetical protein